MSQHADYVQLPYLPSSLDVTDALVKLCERHPPEEVVKYARNWVTFMENCIAVGARMFGCACGHAPESHQGNGYFCLVEGCLCTELAP